jgi:hypothetical protein
VEKSAKRRIFCARRLFSTQFFSNLDESFSGDRRRAQFRLVCLRVGPYGASLMLFGRLLALSSVLVLTASTAAVAQGVSNAQAEHAAKLALLLGRGVGCDLDTGRATSMIGAWLDRTFPAGSARQDIYLDMFHDTVRQYAAQQRAGRSPDSCADIAQAFETMGW